MSEWEMVTLSGVAERVAVKNVNEAVTRVMTVSAAHGLIDQEKFFTKPVASSNLSTYYVIQPGDFVYNKSTSKDAEFGVVARLNGDEAAVVTPLYIPFRARPGVVDPDFLLLAANGSAFFGSLAGMLREGARSHGLLNVLLAEFFAARVPLPPINEQRRIITITSAVDTLAQAVENEIHCARRSFRALIAHQFGIDAETKRASVADCATLVSGRAFPAKFQGQRTGEIPYVKVSDLGANDGPRQVSTATNWVSSDVAKELTARICPVGTVLFPIIGAAMLTEKRRILARDAAFDQNVMGLIPNDRVVPEYLFAAMSSIRLGDLRQTGAVPSVNQLLVGAIEIPLPRKEEQEKIAASVDSVLDVIERLSSELAALRTVRADLLSALLSQEITVDAAVDRFVKAA